MLDNNEGQATARLLRLFNQATDEELAYGLSWYAEAHDWVESLAASTGRTVETVAGVVAALSPRTEWALNKRRAEEALQTGHVYGLTHVVSKVRALLDGGDPDEVLRGPKVRSFYSNLLDPVHSDAVTVDRHALDAALGFVGTDKSRKVLERKGVYDEVADAYRSAARVLGVAPHVVQSVVWAVWRNRYGKYHFQRPGGESNVYVRRES